MIVTEQPPLLITSLQNPRVKQLVALRDKKERQRCGLMRVEGFEELSLALQSGAQPITLYYCPQLMRANRADTTIAQVRRTGAELVEVTARVFEKIAYREGPDGWLATFGTIDRGLPDLELPEHPLLVVAAGVEKPGNLGAMLRTADAAGVHAMLAADPVTDWGNPNIVRASKGALFSVPVAAARSPETIAWLHENRIAIVAATPQATASYTDVDLSGAVAIAVGEEKYGLSAAWLDAADMEVRIPMVGSVNSLNVATSMALLVYEAVRQRGMKH